MKDQNKEFYVTVKGQKVAVSEEVYRAYIRPVRLEHQRQKREWRCQVKGKKGNLVRCQNDCAKCLYALAGNNARGNVLSLESFEESGVDIVDNRLDIEQKYIDEEEKQKLYSAISKLTPRQQAIVKMVYFEGISQEKVSAMLGVTKSAISHSLERIYGALRRILEKN